MLVVEDDNSARRAIAQILKRLGYAPLEAATVAEALRALEPRAPEWILLDLMLPDGSGLDVLRKVRSDKLPSRVCVISGCDSVVLDEARVQGPEHVLTKPLNVRRLLEVLAPPKPPADS